MEFEELKTLTMAFQIYENNQKARTKNRVEIEIPEEVMQKRLLKAKGFHQAMKAR